MSRGSAYAGFGFELPIRTKTENNNDEHWRKRWRRAKYQRDTVHQYLVFLRQQRFKVWLPLTVTMIRVAPRQLDDIDNLSSAMKHIRDGIADFLEIDDRTPLVQWHYAQTRGRPKYYGIRIILQSREEHI